VTASDHATAVLTAHAAYSAALSRVDQAKRALSEADEALREAEGRLRYLARTEVKSPAPKCDHRSCDYEVGAKWTCEYGAGQVKP